MNKKYQVIIIFNKMQFAIDFLGKECYNIHKFRNHEQKGGGFVEFLNKDNDFSHDPFTEIVIEGDENEDSSKTIPIKVDEKQRAIVDEIRNRFHAMRSLYNGISFRDSYNVRLQAVLFYRQATFMADFEDNYNEQTPFFMYFPDLSSMNYSQLRTYFTWRTKVRKGYVGKIPYSYVFVYIYELLNNIGVKDGRDGLKKLAFIWKTYRIFEESIDKYMIGWVHDYYITNDKPMSFEELFEFCPSLEPTFQFNKSSDFYETFSPLSHYKLEKSAFCNDENFVLIRNAFNHTIEKLSEFAQENGYNLHNLLYVDSKSTIWSPFKEANFIIDSQLNKNRRTVVISDHEKYRFSGENWYSVKPPIPKSSGKALISYIIKRIEQFYRKANGYKYKLNVSSDNIVCEIPLEQLLLFIDKTIVEFYRKSQQKIISVDFDRLDIIRKNAELTQEKLIISDEIINEEKPIIIPEKITPKVEEFDDSNDVWQSFSMALSIVEKDLLKLITQGKSLAFLMEFLKEKGLMLEVLIDKINEKAFDKIGDNIIEISDEIFIYDDYLSDVKGSLI